MRSLRDIGILKEKYGFIYKKGNPITQLIFKNYGKNMDILLREAKEKGESEIVKYALEKGANTNFQSQYNNYIDLNPVPQHDYLKDEALIYASRKGDLYLVKKIVGEGANIHFQQDYALKEAKKNGHLEIVDYLESLKESEKNEHLETVKLQSLK